MTVRFFTWGEELPQWAVVVTVVICGLWVLHSLFETREEQTGWPKRNWWLILSGVLSGCLVCLAVLRPATVQEKSSSLGAKVIVLVDRARRMTLTVDGRSRMEQADIAYGRLLKHFEGLRVTSFEFGGEKLRPMDLSKDTSRVSLAEHSDVMVALAELANGLDEKASAIVVLSDGRWPRPEEDGQVGAFSAPLALKGTVIHTVDVSGRLPRDASVLSVQTVGSIIAHQPLSIDVTVYCAKALNCGKVPVIVREHKKGVPPSVLARGEAMFTGESTSRVTLEIVLERAGSRIIEIAIAPQAGDEVPENDSRLLVLQVIRDRLRLLHVAGRPTYDVRALRTWLKSDSSVDLVSFFILRTDGDDTNADEDSELALIPFPVDELFTEHLPSFDAVILQDIDAERYRLAGHFESLARYVEQGGGLLLVGGPSAFSGGAYANSPLERVLPITLVKSAHPFDTVEFIPRVTGAGRSARLLDPLRSVLGAHLPNMPGANTLGPVKPNAVVLWEHPNRTALPIKTGGAPGPMPVLAVGEAGDGRVVALGVDGTHRLAWGQDGLSTAGRAYGAFWDGLLGWVMRERRFESAVGEIDGNCIAGSPTRARVSFSSPVDGEVTLEVQRLMPSAAPVSVSRRQVTGDKNVAFELLKLAEGGYSALVRVGDAPAARFEFACERGGSAWADSRPDSKRLTELAEANGGRYVDASEVRNLPRPEAAQVTTYRQVTSWLPSWVWAFGASLALAAHWLLRRLSGLP